MCPFREAGVESLIPAWSNIPFTQQNEEPRQASLICNSLLFTVIGIHTWARHPRFLLGKVLAPGDTCIAGL